MEKKEAPTGKEAGDKDKANVVSQKTGWRKHLGRFWNFVMFGGWIVIAIAVLAIAIAVSTCGR